MAKPMLLIVDDEKPTREGLRAALEDRYDVYVAEDVAAAMSLLEQDRFAVVLSDFRLPTARHASRANQSRSFWPTIASWRSTERRLLKSSTSHYRLSATS